MVFFMGPNSLFSDYSPLNRDDSFKRLLQSDSKQDVESSSSPSAPSPGSKRTSKRLSTTTTASEDADEGVGRRKISVGKTNNKAEEEEVEEEKEEKPRKPPAIGA